MPTKLLKVKCNDESFQWFPSCYVKMEGQTDTAKPTGSFLQPWVGNAQKFAFKHILVTDTILFILLCSFYDLLHKIAHQSMTRHS